MKNAKIGPMKAKMPKSMDAERDDDFEAEEDLRYLEKAEEIKADPARMMRVAKKVGRKYKAITSLKDLTEIYDEKYGSGALKRKPREQGE